MGGGGKGGSSTQTVSIPQDVLNRYNAVNARAESVAQTPFTPYSTTPENFVAPLTGTQQASIANINAQQGSANQAVQAGQAAQTQGVNTAQIGQGQAQGIANAALQGISQAQQQGTAYNQVAGQNIGQAMTSAAPYMQAGAGLQGQGYGQQQGYQNAASQAIGNIMNYAAPYLQGNAALQQQGLAQQQGYQNAATQNAANIASSADPYLSGNAAMQQQGYSQQQAAQNAAIQNAANIARAGSPAQQQNIALQQAGLSQQQGYQNAATQNIGGAMGAAAPYMGQMAGLTQQGLGQGQEYLTGATGLTQQAIQTGQQYANQANPYYTGALSAAQPLNQQAASLANKSLDVAAPLNQQAAAMTEQGVQAAQPLNQQATNLTNQAMQAASPLNQQAQSYLGAGAQGVSPEALNYSQYMNPYMKDVVGAQQALMQQENAQQRSSLQGQAIQAGAFGGDRAGIAQANLARQQSLANQATLANLLQSGYGQAQAAAQQQQGVNLGAAQANRAAQQQAVQQAANLGQQQYQQAMGTGAQLGTLGQQQYAQGLGAGAQYGNLAQQQANQALAAGSQLGNLGQQNYAQNLGVGQGLANLGQQQYGQALGTGAQIGQLGQQGYQQNLGAGSQLGNVGQQLYGQNLGQGQALAALGQQGLQAMQGTGQNIGAAGMNLSNLQAQQAQQMSNIGQQALQAGQTTGTNLGNIGMNRAALQGQQAQQMAALGGQGLAALQGTGTNLGNIGSTYANLAAQQGQGLSNLGAQALQAGQTTGTNLANIGQQLFGQNIGQGQAIGALGQQQFGQGLSGAQAAAGIGQNAYGNAANLAGIQQAGGMNAANLGIQNQAAQIAAGQAQMAAGQQQQQTLQAGLTALYNQFQQGQGYPFQVAQFLANIAEGTGALSGSTTSATRTGQRGGRMGDGYASGGFVPDSQGGAVLDPGAYWRGGYADGGSSTNYNKMVTDAFARIGRTGFGTNVNQIDKPTFDDYVNKLKSGEIAPDQFNTVFNQGAQDYMAKNPDTDLTKYVQGAMQKNNDQYAKMVTDAFSGIGRKGFGTNVNQIDQPTYNSYVSKLQSGEITPDQFNTVFNQGAQDYMAKNPDTALSKYVGGVQKSNADYKAVSSVNPEIASYFKNTAGFDIDPANAQKYQDMLAGGMSLDQVKYNIAKSNPTPSTPTTKNQYGSSVGSDFYTSPAKTSAAQASTQPQPQPQQATGKGAAPGQQDQPQQATGKGAAPAAQQTQPQQAAGKGASQPQQQQQYGYQPQQQQYGYQQYGYQPQQPSNYGMPNFGSSPQYGGAPDYAGAGAYGAQQARYNNQPQQAAGKGAAPAQQPQQASGKGASQPQPQPQQASGKGASGYSSGGRAAFADGGRIGYATGGFDMSSHLRQAINAASPGDPLGTNQSQAAMYASSPYLAGSAGGLNIPGGASAQRQMLQPQRSILPQQTNGIKEAAQTGASIASLGEAGGKLYDKLTKSSSTSAQDAQKVFDKFGSAKQIELDKAGGLNAPTGGFKLFGENNAVPTDAPSNTSTLASEMPTAAGKGVDMAASGGRIGHNSGGRTGYNIGGIPGLNDLKQGHADIPGGAGEETPLSDVVKQGTQTPSELANEMKGMSASGSTGLGGSSGSGVAGAIGTAASIASLGKMAFTAGSWIAEALPALLLARGGRVGKAGGGALSRVKVDTKDPKYRAMKIAFDKLLVRYDHNPLLAAAALEAGVSVVDNAIRKAHQVDGEITDFLPRKTQEYLFALSQAAMGAHSVEAGRMGRKAGGRTGYALPGEVDDTPTATGLLPSNAMTLGDVGGDLPAPEPTTQVAGETSVKGSDYDAIIGRASKETGIPADLLRAQIKQESRFEPNAIGKAGEIGLTQILPSTAKKPGFGLEGVDPETLRDPEQNIMFGAKYLAARGQAVGVKDWSQPEDAAKGLRAYNGGGDPNYVANVYRHMGVNVPSTEKPTGLGAAAPAAKSDQGPWEKTFSSLTKDTVPTDSSFWVPLIAGLGSMLASNQYRFSQRLGEGLIGGAAAYGKQQEFGLQKEKVDIERQNNALTMFGKLFQPQYNKDGQLEYLNVRTGEVVSPSEASRLMFGSGVGVGSLAPATGAATTTQPRTVTPAAGGTEVVTVPQTVQKAETEQKTVVQPDQFKSFEDVDAWARSHPRVADLQKKADSQQNQISTYQNELDKLPSNALTATRRAELTTLLANARNLEQSYRKNADEQAEKLATSYKTQLAKRFEVGPEMTEAEAGKAATVESAKNNVKYFEDQAAADQARQQTRVQLGAIRTILENYQPGTFAQEKAQLVGALRSAGIDVPSSATANPEAFEEFTKEMMKNVFSNVKEIGGQIRVAEMAGLKEASNNPSLQPLSNKKVLAQGLGILDAADKRYSDEVSAYQDQGPTKFNRAKFQLDWRKTPENDPQKFISEAEKNTAVRGATPSDISEMSAGHVYVIEPSNAFGVAIDKPQKLRFMGVNPETGNPRWQRVQ